MFEGLKGMAGLAGLMKDLPKMKAKMEQVKKDLAHITVEAESGGGAVRVTADGHLRVTSIRIDQAIMSGLLDSTNDDDRAMAEDLIAGAVNVAMEKARQRAAEEMARVAEELGLPVSPGALGGLLS